MPRTLTIKQTPGKPGQVYYPLHLSTDAPKPKPNTNELLIQIHASALNHRDFFIRQHLYPGISFDAPLLADGYGTVVECGPASSSELLGKRVILSPCRGWEKDPDGPEDITKFEIVGGVELYPTAGTAQDYVVVSEGHVELCPDHLTPAEGAALPLVGLTAWRALVTKSHTKPGQNLLITGIGGGVALQALQFATAMGCNVWVTSSDSAKIEKAKKMGAKGGVIYKTPGWAKELVKMLPAERPYLDAVIDGAGGQIVKQTVRLLKPGGVIVQYGMTVGPVMDWLMQAVLKNISILGTTMGSRAEFKDMVNFVRENKIRPVVSRSVTGLDNLDAIDALYDDMKHARQFGKLVIEISTPAEAADSKL